MAAAGRLTRAVPIRWLLAGAAMIALVAAGPGVARAAHGPEPAEDVGQGDAWIGQLVNAVAQSPYWNSTAIFVTYDEGGGFWDHVPPPAGTGYGTRTPMLIVSPWARTGVFHQQTTNISILSFLQHLWGLAPLTRLNAQQNDLMGAFDFHQAPLAPPTVPTAPADTIGFHGSSILSDIGSPNPGSPLTINLYAETGGLTLDSNASGTVSLSVTPPPVWRHRRASPARSRSAAARRRSRRPSPPPATTGSRRPARAAASAG